MNFITMIGRPRGRRTRAALGMGAMLLMLATALFGQTEPINSVDITTVYVLKGQGGVLLIDVTSGGSGYTTAPAVTISGGGGSGATATATISNGSVTGITVVNTGSGYTSAPTITVAGTGSQATATAQAPVGGVLPGITLVSGGSGYITAPTVTISGGTPVTNATATATITGGVVTAINLTSGGTGYTGTPTVTISAPPSSVATAVIPTYGNIPYLGDRFSSPNEAYGPFGVPIAIEASGRGTFLKGSFIYTFFVNGTSIGSSPAAVPPPRTDIALWTPPQPGAYLLTTKIADGLTPDAFSLAVRYFATGTAIVGPVEGTIVPNGSSVVIQATATPAPIGPDAFVKRVEFWIDGQLSGTDTTYPYSMIYTPSANGGSHTILARAYDNQDNLISPTATRSIRMVSPVGTPPTVRLLNPLNGSSTSAGTTVNLIADAASATGFIKNVDFYVNGVALASSQTFPFTSTWKSTVPGKYQFVAIAYDDKSNAVASSPVDITITGGFPTIGITSPDASGAIVYQGAKLTVAVTAGGADGGISSLKSIELLVDGNVTDSLPKNPDNLVPAPPLTQPFNFDWTSNVAIGQHRLAARVTDINNLTITSSEIPITVLPNTPPTVTITNPTDGSSGGVNSPVLITASATDKELSIASVEFFANNNSLGKPVTTSTNGAFTFSWTPTAAGVYTLTAKAIDAGGASAISAPVSVTIDPAATTTGASNSVYRGDYGSPTESGHFALGINRNGRGTLIAFSTSPAGKTYFWNDFAVNADGTFSAQDGNGVTVSGQTGVTGVVGTFGNKTFIGPIASGSGTPLILSGALTGGNGGSVVILVGGDNTITLFSSQGTKTDAGTGTVTTGGGFTVTTPNAGSFTGFVTTPANIISGSVSGGTTGSFVVREVPSRLINLSTRALAGTGERTLIAGFMVSGTGTKPLLVRAVGPTLVNFGVSNVLANPSLSVVKISNSSTVASNDDWSDSTALRNLAAQVGAFPLSAGSKDAALQTSLAPGMYSAIVGGGSSTAQQAMVELYDAESASAGTTRLSNLSARCLISSGDTIIAGFVISGDQRKKLLIRAVGPTLANFGIANFLADPKIEIVSGTTVIASNDNWSGSTVSTTGSAVGAFSLVPGSLDAATVVQLSPGGYTVQASGVGGSSGIVLLEIYDADP